MANYVIDPMIFYWIKVFSGLEIALYVLGGIAVIACILCFICWAVYASSPFDQEDLRKVSAYKKCSIKLGIAGAILILIAIFVPDKPTFIEMLVAKTATFSNVEWTVDQIKEIVDYVISAIKGV